MELPLNHLLKTEYLAKVFNNTSATYKYYWLLALLDSVEIGKQEIKKIELFSRMIANSWYTVNYFKVSFGSQDLIQEKTKELLSVSGLPINARKNEISKVLSTSTNKKIQRQLFHFNNQVPHWFLSPWYSGKQKQHIYKLSQDGVNKPPYSLLEDKIIIDKDWFEYFQVNQKIIRDFTLWNLTDFLEKRNPNTPNISQKLVKPPERGSLTKQKRKYWDIFLNSNSLNCIFSNQPINPDKYDLDHFIPHSFVSHDLIWNLIPINPCFNSTKSNKIPNLEFYFSPFYEVQKKAYFSIMESIPKNFQEEFFQIFGRVESEVDFKLETYRNNIAPLARVALNNGFEELNP